MTELDQKTRNQFIIKCHMNYDAVKEAVTERPEIVNSYNPKINESGLGAAGHVGNRQIAEYLLSHGAELELGAAAMLGMKTEVSEFIASDPSLLKKGGAHGISIGYHAVLSGDIDIVQMIWDAGEQEAVKGSLIAAINKGKLDMVRWLLDHEADISVTNFNGKTPLEVAQEHGHAEIAALLQAQGK